MQKLHSQFSILHNPFETAKKLGRKNRVQNTTGHGNRSRRSDLASLMFTATSRGTTDALASPERHRIYLFQRCEVTRTADEICELSDRGFGA
ncbi:hypothetical protein AVEN_50682-1 [Araneus ventricosus]|uniref:Uncharacterized protein n=1 Tax=Araneus ventricosus TaxID=182803 RepID=A0A4Y2PAW4_ARAVE|nr:hypothetical protein AVEN_50682-1 [Araneus ventricosus]